MSFMRIFIYNNLPYVNHFGHRWAVSNILHEPCQLAWNFFDEIRQQLAEYEAGGGRFILPLPYPHIVI